MLQRFDPFAIEFGNGFGIRWYGLAYLAGFLAGYLFMRRMAEKGRTALKSADVGDFVFAVAMGTIIGGRLGFCLLYDQSLLYSFTADFPFWGALALHKGGMASHGGILGIILACVWYAKKKQLSPLGLMDLTVVAGALGIFFGRIANFINGELVGRPCSPTLPWAVKFPQDILLWPHYEPERLTSLAPVVEKLSVSSARWEEFLGQAGSLNQVEDILHKIIYKVQSGNALVSNALEPLLTPRHPSQLYEALLEGALLFIVAAWMWSSSHGKNTWRRHGVITAVFLNLYGIVRIIGEQFRMPDAFIGFQWLGLTRGQWLSAVLLLGSSIFGAWCFRRGKPASLTNVGAKNTGPNG